MGELCKFLNITRQTLSRYKHRNYLWRKSIEEIRSDISFWNFMVKINGYSTMVLARLEDRMTEQGINIDDLE